MKDPNRRPARQVGIADHLWDTFELMAEQMGSDRDALINQALFMFARLNGFLDAGREAPRAAVASAAQSLPTPPPRSSPPVFTPAPAVASPRAAREELTPRPQPAPARPDAAPDAEPSPREEGRSFEPAPEPDRFERMKGRGIPTEPPRSDEEAAEASAPADAGRPQLYVLTEGGDLDKITKERFVIGRGKHCDFVIHSGKVSREHAVIVREGDAYFIEDLGSSNGTWFNKQRIKRRRIEEGDEYFICNEKIKLVLR
jgi:FHA domain